MGNEESGTVFQPEEEMLSETPKGTIPVAIPAQKGLGHDWKSSGPCKCQVQWVGDVKAVFNSLFPQSITNKPIFR